MTAHPDPRAPLGEADLDAIQARIDRALGFSSSPRYVDGALVTLLAEVRRARAEVERYQRALAAESEAHAEARGRLRVEAARLRAILAPLLDKPIRYETYQSRAEPVCVFCGETNIEGTATEWRRVADVQHAPNCPVVTEAALAGDGGPGADRGAVGWDEVSGVALDPREG